MLDAATCLDGTRAPKPGDISVCLYCGTVLEFGPRLNLQLVTQETIEDLSPETQDLIRRAVLAIMEKNASG